MAAVLGGVASLSGGENTGPAGGSQSTSTPEANLQVVDLVVSGGHQATCLKDPPDPQRLDLTVRNVGDQPAVIKRVGFRIRATGLLLIPEAGGELEPSKNYDVLLPGKPRIGELVLYKISQEVKPAASDRFTIRLDEPGQYKGVGDRIYQLDVLLYHDTARAPVKAGTVLVATPSLPDKSFFWTGVPPEQQSDYKGSPVRRRFEHNEKTFRRMLALTGERAPELNTDLVDVPAVPVTGDEPNPCLPSGSRAAPKSAQTSSEEQPTP